MKQALATLTAIGAMAAMTTTLAQTISFDQDAAGAAPAGWRAGVTGRGSPKWLVIGYRRTFRNGTCHQMRSLECLQMSS